MKAKRFFAALAAAVILCGATGCSSGKTTTTDTSPRKLVSLTENGRPVSPGVLRGSDGISGNR